MKILSNDTEILAHLGSIHDRKFEWDSEYQNLTKLLNKFSTNDKGKLLSIVIPVYNEEKTIRAILERLPNHRSIEIIIVDDYSTDNSLDEISNARNADTIKLVKHKYNKGYGSALLTGIDNAEGTIIVTMDSDGQHRPEDIFYLVEPILANEADITVGSRYYGSYNYQLPVSTRLGEAVIEKFMYILFGRGIMNNQGGFRAFHKKTLKIFNNIKFKDYAFTTELLLKASLFNFKVKECPIHLIGREYGTSKIVLSKLILNLLLCVGYYTLKRINNPHYKKWLLKRFYFIKNLPIYKKQTRIENVAPKLEPRIFLP